jgi:phenylacetate-coenzyme A ligase PaaK-like adenylate-forming protein
VFTALEQIEGRCDDVFYLPAVEGERLVPVFPDFIRRAVMTASAEIQEYATLQTAPGQLEVALRVPAAHRGEAESRVIETLGALFDSLEIAHPQVRFTPYDLAPGLTKLRRVERRFQPETTLV